MGIHNFCSNGFKIKNFDCERWLQYYAEPFYNFASLLGLNTNDKYLELAWKLLVQNSAHDSIGGCSLDYVHEDMINRFKQVNEISKGIYSKALQFIIANGEIEKKVNPNENYLTAFNPTSYQRDEVVPFVVDVPIEIAKNSIRIFDLNDNEMEVQITKRLRVQPNLEQMIDRPMYVDVVRFFGFAHLKSIPSFGYKTFKFIPAKENHERNKLAKTQNGKIVLENEYLKVKININGTFDILDKTTNKKFSNLGYFYDEESRVMLGFTKQKNLL